MNPDIHVTGFIIGGLIIASALMVVISRVPIHAACFLILTLFGIAAEYVVLEAHTIAVFQVLVYAGAIVVLIAFVLMLLGPGSQDDEVALENKWRVWVGLIIASMLIVLFFYTTRLDRIEPATTAVNPEHFGQLDGLGHALLSGYVLPFEVISLLLMVAIVGAVALLRKRAETDEEEMK